MECRVVYRSCDGLFATAFRYEDGIAIDIGDDVCMVERDGSWTVGKCLGFSIDETGPTMNVGGDMWRLDDLERDGTAVVRPVRDRYGDILHLGQMVRFADGVWKVEEIDQTSGDVLLETLHVPSRFIEPIREVL